MMEKQILLATYMESNFRNEYKRLREGNKEIKEVIIETIELKGKK